MDSQKGDSLKNIDKPVIAGILMIIVFVMALVAWGSLTYLGQDIVGEGECTPALYNLPACLGTAILLFEVILFIGTVCAIKRVYWPVALIGSIFGIFTIGPYYLGSILSIAAFLLLITSHGKFTLVGKSSEHFVDAGGFGRRQGGGNVGGGNN